MEEKPEVVIEDRIRSTGEHVHNEYNKGKLLGKGGFAKCYEMVDLRSNALWAGKVVEKSSLKKPRAKQKLMAEIKIHRSLSHENIVKFHHFFEDSNNVYILLELCPNKSMMEFVKKRKRLTESEAAYYMLQLIDATKYMHAQKVIHRDLKLGNLFLNQDMQLKIGDYGLATNLTHDGERKRTICGTPNYIAPEILEGKDGHSYEVDIWSLGVIMYTFIYGKPPFETSDVKTTYKKIKTNSYTFPDTVAVSPAAKNLIKSILMTQPDQRPSLDKILAHPWFKSTPIPSSIPQSALLQPTRVTSSSTPAVPSPPRLPLSELPNPRSTFAQPMVSTARLATGSASRPLLSARTGNSIATSAALAGDSRVPSSLPSSLTRTSSTPSVTELPISRITPSSFAQPMASTARLGPSSSRPLLSARGAPSVATPVVQAPVVQTPVAVDDDDKKPLDRMREQLEVSLARLSVRDQAPLSAVSMPVTAPKSVEAPPQWITKWVDYSSAYGLGYQLCNNSIGVYFNDATKMVLSPDEAFGEYYSTKEGSSTEERLTFTFTDFPVELTKKITLLKHFRSYMAENTPDADKASSSARPSSSSSAMTSGPMPHVKKWLRTRHAIIFRLSNKSVQVNFFDHTKLILSSEMRMVTYINKQKERSVHSLQDARDETNPELTHRIRYTKDILHLLVADGIAPVETS